MADPDGLMHQLHQTARAISRDLNLRFERFGIFSAEWGVISVLKKRGPMSQVALAGYLNIESPAISKTLLKLERKSLIERKCGRSRRENLVSLTTKAEALYHDLLALLAAHHAKVLTGISDEDAETLLRILRVMFDNACRPRPVDEGETAAP